MGNFNTSTLFSGFAPSDFIFFQHLSCTLEASTFANDDEVQAEANHWLRRQDTAWYNSGIKKLLQRYQKCLERNGDYVEKLASYGVRLPSDDCVEELDKNNLGF
ncbi:hypothetical protein LAZ67_1005669, partial [Cordylochernes scorpioides]